VCRNVVLGQKLMEVIKNSWFLRVSKVIKPWTHFRRSSHGASQFVLKWFFLSLCHNPQLWSTWETLRPGIDGAIASSYVAMFVSGPTFPDTRNDFVKKYMAACFVLHSMLPNQNCLHVLSIPFCSQVQLLGGLASGLCFVPAWGSWSLKHLSFDLIVRMDVWGSTSHFCPKVNIFADSFRPVLGNFVRVTSRIAMCELL